MTAWGAALATVLQDLGEVSDRVGSDIGAMGPRRTSMFLQTTAHICDAAVNPECSRETLQVEVVFFGLLVCLLASTFLVCFLRDPPEEHITPLVPSMIVKDSVLRFAIPVLDLGAKDNKQLEILEGHTNVPICRILMDFPDPFRPGGSGVGATARLQNSKNATLANIVVRHCAVQGQGLALCRGGCEIFGFVEPRGSDQYLVRHRTGVHLLTIDGSWDNIDLHILNPVGTHICTIKQNTQDALCGRLLQGVDAGLIITSFLAAYIERCLRVNPPQSPQRMRTIRDHPTGDGGSRRNSSKDRQDRNRKSRDANNSESTRRASAAGTGEQAGTGEPTSDCGSEPTKAPKGLSAGSGEGSGVAESAHTRLDDANSATHVVEEEELTHESPASDLADAADSAGDVIGHTAVDAAATRDEDGESPLAQVFLGGESLGDVADATVSVAVGGGAAANDTVELKAPVSTRSASSVEPELSAGNETLPELSCSSRALPSGHGVSERPLDREEEAEEHDEEDEETETETEGEEKEETLPDLALSDPGA